MASQPQQRSHVPKFGNWENDNIPYTTYFENARKEKTGVMINPNDPQENPEAFMFGRGEVELSFGHPGSVSVSEEQQHDHHRHRDRKKCFTSESGSGSDKSNSDYSLLQAGFRREKSNRNKEQGEGAHHHRAASVPKFGAWDETDPNSGEGFTVIFNRVKEEKQIASAAFPSLPPQAQPTYHSHTRSSFFSRFKFCCCPFSCGNK